MGSFGSIATTSGVLPGLSSKQCTAQSIMKALDNFMVAMNHMSDVVMVPNRLKDIQLPTPNVSEKALVSASDSTTPSDLFSYYRMLQCVQQELCFGSEDLPKRPSSVASSCRSSGQESPSESESEDGDSEIRDARAHQLATNFKIHLQGLADVIHQMTDTAKYLSDTYQEDVKSEK